MRKTSLFSLCQNILDFIFPLQCVFCYEEGKSLCDICYKSLLNFYPQNEKAPFTYERSNEIIWYLDELFYTHDYKNCKIGRKLLYSLKNSGRIQSAKPLRDLLDKTLIIIQEKYCIKIDKLIPVPSGYFKIIARGFDHTTEICKSYIDNQSPCSAKLIKNKFTTSQKNLKFRERFNNLNNAFRVDGKVPAHAFIFDDVATTLATLNEAAKELKKQGAEKVSAVVLFRRLKFKQ